MSIPIIRAKLRPPALPDGYIPRPHLLDRLQTGQGKKLTLIVAGAGYGKSTLLAEWVQKNNRVLWYSLDATDRDPAVFFAYLLARLGELWPEFGHTTEAILNRPVPPDPERLAITLVGELESALEAQRLLVVFDDYHRLGDAPAVDAVMGLLLERLPSSAHTAISSRVPVGFPAARLRSAGQVNELTNVDLCFSADEIQHLFHALDPNTVQQLVARTEGWIAGLQLVRQTLAHSGSLGLGNIFKDPTGPLGQIYRYLAEEVFERLPAPLQSFLLQTGMLETFSPDDSDTIFERTDSAQWLTHLINHGLFTIQLQRDPDTYRYHHLLADYLRDKRDREGILVEVRDWHRKAAVYFKERQRWDEAFVHAMNAKDESLAAEMVLNAFTPMRLGGRLETVQDWLNRLSPQMYTSYPLLYSHQGVLWEERGLHEQARGAFHRAIEIAEPRGDRRALVNTWVWLGTLRQRTGDLEGSGQAWQKALEYAEREQPEDRLKALIGLANLHLFSGQNRRALELNRQCLELAALLGKPLQALVMNNLGTTLSFTGEFTEAIHWCENSLKLRREANLLPGIVTCLSNIGRLQTQLGDLKTARSNLDEAIALGGVGHGPSLLANLLSNRGDLAAVEGDFAMAEELYRRSIALKEPLQDAFGLVHTWTRLSELRCRQGDLTEAVACAQRALELGEGKVGPNERLPAQAALALAWLVRGKVEPAVELLTQVIDAHRSITNNHYELTRCLWHLARAQSALGHSSRESLAEALAVAERWNYRFLLTTLSREHSDLLVEAVAASLQPSLVSDLLVALGDAAVPDLAHLLESPDPAVRVRAVERLGALGTDGVWKPLDQATHDPHLTVKQAAMAALSILQRKPPALLHVTTLGRFTLRRGDQPIPDAAWGSNRKAQTLFRYLLTQAGKPVSREDLKDLLWPDREESAGRNLNQAVFTLRRVLEPYLPPRYPSRYLLSEGGTYLLELPADSWVDDLALEDEVAQAQRAQRRGDLEAALAHYQRAADLYKGNYLTEEVREDWHIPRQEHLRQLALKALRALAELCLARGESGRAAEAVTRLHNLDLEN